MPKAPSAALATVLAALMAVAPFTIDAYLPSMPTLATHFAAPMASVQISLSIYMVGFAGGQLFIGPWSDRAGRLTPIFGGLSIYVAATLLCSFAPSIELLNGARFLQGLGAGVGPVVVRAMVRDQFEREDAARLMSLLGMIFMIAPLIAPFVGGWILAWFGWQAIFWFLAVYGAVCLVATFLVVRETHPVAKRSTAPVLSVLTDYGALLRNRRFLGYTLASAGAFAGMFAYFSGSPFVFIDLHGIRAEQYGFLFGVNVVGMIGVNALNRRLIPRFGSERLLRAALTVNVCGGLALVVVTSLDVGGLPLLVACIALYIAPLGMIGANAMAGALDGFPRMAGTASALSGALSYAVGTVAGLAVGSLHDGSALAMGLVMGASGVVATVAYRTMIGPNSKS